MKIDRLRLLKSLEAYSQIGTVQKIGVERIALSKEDQKARDLLKSQMIAAGLEVHIDQIGNMIGIRQGEKPGPAVAMGSHLDTVYHGGRFDGALGVLAGLEVIHRLNDLNIKTEKPIALINFTNEEGVRFAPDMMGSHVWAHPEMCAACLESTAYDQPDETVKDRLKAIGYAGSLPCGSLDFDSFLELHIEQGPMLELERINVGAVNMVQGIYWTRYMIMGQANHAGTTPLKYRKDAGYAASEITQFIGDYSRNSEAYVLTTVGTISFEPNAINIVPEVATFTLDLRSADNEALKTAQRDIDEHVIALVEQSGLTFKKEEMVRFPQVEFSHEIVNTIRAQAVDLNLTVKKMPSGAGHDAQMMASVCPSAMIFVPSVGGISHSIREYTYPDDLENGANVLFRSVLDRAREVKN